MCLCMRAWDGVGGGTKEGNLDQAVLPSVCGCSGMSVIFPRRYGVVPPLRSDSQFGTLLLYIAFAHQIN